MLLLLLACTPAATDTAKGDSATDSASDSGTDSGTDSAEDSQADCDADGDGACPPEDCDDADPSIHPGAIDDCDGTDSDCDGTIDEDAAPVYTDSDNDGVGGAPSTSCSGVATTGDCDDTNPAVHPGATDGCDGVDSDCDGSTDEDATFVERYRDGDGDGWGDAAIETCGTEGVAQGGDCDDRDPGAYPGAPEVCDNVDQDCDGVRDDEPVDGTTWYADSDGDSYGDPASPTTACTQPRGSSANADDCADGDSTIHPGAIERCGGVDEDCDGLIDDADPDLRDPSGVSSFHRDSDGDGYGDPALVDIACVAPVGDVADGTDCDDADPAVYPGAAEHCDGHDEDCGGDGDLPAAEAVLVYTDGDADGYGGTGIGVCDPGADALYVRGDCDDANAAVHPGAREVCGDGVDDDCLDGDASDCAPSGVGISPWVRFTTNGDGDYFGAGVAIGDFNGDGVDDLAAGSPADDGAGTDAGLVAIWYGPFSAGDRTTDDADVRLTGEAAGDSAGSRLLAGDTDGDGIDELVVLAPHAGGDAGRVYVIRAPVSGTLPTATTIDADPGAHLGYAMDLGDIDGDGLADLLLGVPDGVRGEVWLYSGPHLAGALTRADADTRFTAELGGSRLGVEVAIAGDLDGDGAVDLALTDSSILEGWLGDGALYLLSGPFAPGETSLRGSGRGLIGAADEGDVGRRLAAAGDLDGDGYGDLLVSEPGDFGSTGVVHVLHGPTPEGWPALGDVADDINGYTHCELGRVVAGLGDVDEDGLADIGFACTQRSSSAGGLVLAYGPAAITSSEAADYRLGIESYYTGTALASGDLDGDGHLDVAIGGYGSLYSSGAWSYPGSVVVVHGGASTAATVTVPEVPATDADGDGVAAPEDCDDTRADTFPGAPDTCGDALDQDCDGADAHCAPLGDQDNSDFTMWFSSDDGGSMRRSFAADVDADGQDDLVLADGSVDRDTAYSVGGIGVVYGPVPRWTATWDQADTFVLGTESAGSLGAGLTHGDLDGDGLLDVVVGGTTSDLAASNAGHVAILQGARWTATGSFDDAWATVDGAKDDEIGSVLVAGDLDGDGIDELVVGSYGYGTKGGAVWVWSGVDGARTTADADTFLDGDTYNTYVDELVVADVDGDGHGDLLVGYPNITTSAGGAVDVFAGPIDAGSFALSAGDAHWTSSTMAAVGRSIAAGDVDGDGSTDVFVGGYNGYSTLRFGPLALAAEDLSAGDSLTINYGDTSSCGGAVGFVDLDGDGAVDVLGHCGSEVYGWYGPVDASSTLDPAAPTFRVWESTLGTDGGTYTTGDLDGDGYVDILDAVGLYSDPYAIVIWGGAR